MLGRPFKHKISDSERIRNRERGRERKRKRQGKGKGETKGKRTEKEIWVHRITGFNFLIRRTLSISEINTDWIVKYVLYYRQLEQQEKILIR